MKSPDLDAVFIHGQGYKNRQAPDGSPRPSVPSTPGRLAIVAAKWLEDEYGVRPEQYVFSGYTFPGQKLSLARVDADALKNKLSLSEQDVVVEETARTTLGEVRSAAREAREHGWRKIVHITIDPLHKKEIQMLTKRTYHQGVQIDVVTAEELLNHALPNKDDNALRKQEKYRRYLKRYNTSKNAIALRLYEIPKVIITALHGEKLLEKISEKYRPDPTQSPVGFFKKLWTRRGRI